MSKFGVIYVSMCIFVLCLSAQTTHYKGKMTVGDYVQNDVLVELRESINKADGTIFDVKFSRLMPIKVNAEIRGLNRTPNAEKIFISGNNLIPYVRNKQKDKYIITHFNGVKNEDKFFFSTYFGDKKVIYNGKKVSK